MAKGPGLFSEIGKKARDVLYKDFTDDCKLNVTTAASSGLVFTSSGSKKGETFVGEMCAQFKRENFTTDVKLDSLSNISTSITLVEGVPGLKTVLKFAIPDEKSNKLELQYLHDHVGLSTGVGLVTRPIADFSVVFGNKEFSIGGEFSFDTMDGNLTKYNTGMSIRQPDFDASILLANKGDTIKLSYSHVLSPLTNSIVAFEFSHSISKNDNYFTAGGLYMLDPLTAMKLRANHQGKVAGLLQHEWQPKSFVTLSGEIDAKALDKGPKLGLSLALKS